MPQTVVLKGYFTDFQLASSGSSFTSRESMYMAGIKPLSATHILKYLLQDVQLVASGCS